MNLTQYILSSKSKEELKSRKFIIVGSNANHGFALGSTVRFDGKDGKWIIGKNDEGSRYTLDPTDIEIIPENKKEIEEVLAADLKKVEETKELLKFLEDTKATTIDPRAFKVWRIIQAIEEVVGKLDRDNGEKVKSKIYDILNV